MYTNNAVDKALEHWYQMFLTIVDKHTLLKEQCVKIVNQPKWITEEIIHKMAQQDHYKDMGDEDYYRLTRNIIELSKTEYYTTLVVTNQGNSQMLWSYLRELVPKCVKHVSSSLIDSLKKLTDPQEIANKFNDFFTFEQLHSDKNCPKHEI